MARLPRLIASSARRRDTLARPRRRGAIPLFAPALGVLAATMLVPAAHALALGDERVARAFLYAGIATGFASAILWVALSGRRLDESAQGELATLLAAWVALPLFAAAPLVLLVPWLGIVGGWFEMLVCLTTTGSTLFGSPEALPPSLHLWRGVVAWLGGLMTLMAAYVILAPRRMGGFEVMTASSSAAHVVAGDVRLAVLGAQTPPAADRVVRAARAIVPAYVAATAVLVIAFGAAGGVSLASAVHALGIVSTSGVSPLADGFAGAPSYAVEAIAAVALVVVATSRLFGAASRVGRSVPWRRDPELRLMAALVALATAILFARHWTAALTLENPEGADALEALWGAAFTALSYLTTTGFESAAWESARAWAGLSNPTLVLLGLCAIGGGAATTAGGLKLVRAAALLRHGVREIDRLAQPSAVRGSGGDLGGVLSEGAFLGWAFIMLYAGAIFGVALALATTGLTFEVSLIGAISAVSNTGPAFAAVAPGHGDYSLLGDAQRLILGAGMVLGRIETLAVIALMRPEAWSGVVFGRKRAGNRERERPISRL